MRSARTRWLLGLSAALGAMTPALAPRPLAAQPAPATLVVTVTSARDAAPLPAVRVVVGGVRGGVTRADGVVRLAGLAPGAWSVEASRLGYAPQRVTAQLAEGRITELRLALEERPIPLAALEVQAERRRGLQRLDDLGFFRRSALGPGHFITREELERQQPLMLSDALRRVPGIRLDPTPFHSAIASMNRNGPHRCPIQYFVDGVPVYGYNIDDMPPGDVEGIEIYRGAGEIPAEFNRRTAGCGVIVLWTRID